MIPPTTKIPTPRVQIPVSPSPVFFGAGMTHVGLVRERNEDAILTDPEGTLWAVADGMGGHGSGDVASDIVIETLSRVPEKALPGPALQTSLRNANERICKAAMDGSATMGATVVALMIVNGVATVAWVGDCRAYLLRSGALRLLTHDHTVVQDMVDQGLLDPAQGKDHPERHVVTRAVGAGPVLEVDDISVPLVQRDRLLLCSDGLTACLSDQEIADQLQASHDPETLCKSLMTSALRRGAPDNISVVTVFASE